MFQHVITKARSIKFSDIAIIMVGIGMAVALLLYSPQLGHVIGRGLMAAVTGSTDGAPLPPFGNDGRVNADAVAPAVVYPSKTGFEFYSINSQSQGELALVVTCDDINEVPSQPDKNTLIKGSEDGTIRFYRLTTGEFQMNITKPDGTEYVSIWTDDTICQ